MKVAVFGGTGFVGQAILKELVQRGHIPSVLVRKGSEGKVLHQERCRMVSGDISEEDSIRETLRGTGAVIYTIGILREFPHKGITYKNTHVTGVQRCIEITKDIGMKRFILMSANGVKELGTAYQSTKFTAEQLLRKSKLLWTIFRPSLIFGEPHGRIEFCSQLRDQLVLPPLPAPLFYKGLFPRRAGQFLFSPIHVDNVASFFVRSLENDSTINQTFELGGPRMITWKELIETIGNASGKQKLKLPVPALFIQSLAILFGRFEWFPLTKDLITMLMEGNTCDSTAFFNEFEINPIPFSVDSLGYLNLDHPL